MTSLTLAQSQLTTLVAVPICSPQVEVLAGPVGLVLAQFTLVENQCFVLPALHLQFVGCRTLGFATKSQSGLPTVYVGLYANRQAGEHGAPAGAPIWQLGAEVSGLFSTSASYEINTPGTYQAVLINNHAVSAIVAVVTGTGWIFNAT